MKVLPRASINNATCSLQRLRERHQFCNWSCLSRPSCPVPSVPSRPSRPVPSCLHMSPPFRPSRPVCPVRRVPRRVPFSPIPSRPVRPVYQKRNAAVKEDMFDGRRCFTTCWACGRHGPLVQVRSVASRCRSAALGCAPRLVYAERHSETALLTMRQ